MPTRRVVLVLLALLVAPAATGDGALPDLVGHVWPTSVEPGADVRLYGFVENAGGAAAPGVEVSLLVNGTLLGSQRLPALAPGAQAWFETVENATLGAELHSFELRIDVLDEAAEGNESNNVATSVVLFSHARPDLSLVVTSARATGWPSPSVTVDYRMCNHGNRTAGAGGRVLVTGLFYGHGVAGLTPGALPFPDAEHAPLDPGDCTGGTLTRATPDDRAGYRTVSLRADQDGGDPVWERTMTNNRGSANAWMGPGEDPKRLGLL